MKLHYRLILFPIFFLLYEFVGNLSNDMYLPAFLRIAKDFSTAHNYVQATIASWFAGTCVAQLILGPLCDRFGRRPVLIFGGLILLLSTVGCALSPSVWLLILFRFFQGFGVGSIWIAGYASIHALYHDPHKATLILAWTSTIAVSSPMIGPILGSYVLLAWEWRAIFWIILISTSIPFTFVSLIMPESLQPEERHSLHPISLARTYGALLNTRGFVSRAFAFAFLCSGTILWVTAAPYLIMTTYHYSPQTFAYLQVFAPAGFILGAQSIRFYLRFLTRDQLIQSGMTLSFIGAIFMLLSSLFIAQSVYPMLVGIGLYAYGFGALAGPLQREAILAAKTGKGMSTALFFLIMAGTNTLISFLIASLPDSPIIAGFILILISVMAFLCFRLRNPLISS